MPLLSAFVEEFLNVTLNVSQSIIDLMMAPFARYNDTHFRLIDF